MNRMLLKEKYMQAKKSTALTEGLIEMLNISGVSVCHKLKGERQFKPQEIDIIRDELNLTDKDVVDIFVRGEAGR